MCSSRASSRHSARLRSRDPHDAACIGVFNGEWNGESVGNALPHNEWTVASPLDRGSRGRSGGPPGRIADAGRGGKSANPAAGAVRDRGPRGVRRPCLKAGNGSAPRGDRAARRLAEVEAGTNNARRRTRDPRAIDKARTIANAAQSRVAGDTRRASPRCKPSPRPGRRRTSARQFARPGFLEVTLDARARDELRSVRTFPT